MAAARRPRHRHGRRSNREGYRRHSVLSAHHLVTMRREIQETVAVPRSGGVLKTRPDTLVNRLLENGAKQLGVPPPGQEFFVLGRVRMRDGPFTEISQCSSRWLVPVARRRGGVPRLPRPCHRSHRTWTATPIKSGGYSKRRKPRRIVRNTAPRRCGSADRPDRRVRSTTSPQPPGGSSAQQRYCPPSAEVTAQKL